MSESKSKSDADSDFRSVRKLRERLDESHQIHALIDDPLLKVVRIERLRTNVTRALWFFLGLGSAFTTTGVQDFLAGDLTPSDPVWWGAWGVEPCLVGILITILMWEAAMLTQRVEINSKAASWLKRILMGSTLVMNVVPAVWPREGDTSAGMVFAHVMVPVLVFFLAEVMPIIQARCTEAIERAYKAAHKATDDQEKQQVAASKAEAMDKTASTPRRTAPAAPPATPTAPSAPKPDLESQPAPVAEKALPLADEKVTGVNPEVLESVQGLPRSMHARVINELNAVLATGRTPTAEDLKPTGLPTSMTTKILTACNGSLQPS